MTTQTYITNEEFDQLIATVRKIEGHKFANNLESQLRSILTHRAWLDSRPPLKDQGVRGGTLNQYKYWH